jgi:hypothetical protein
MIRTIFFALGFTGFTSIGCAAQAQSFLFHLEGEAGDRRAYFASMLVTDRTAPSIEPQKVETKELAVSIVYENAQMPELAQLNLQFECTGEFYFAYHQKKAPKARPWTDPVKTRVADGSAALRRIDLKTEPVPAGTWETSSELAMLKAHQLACNGPKIDKIVRSATVDGQFSRKTFEQNFSAAGLDGLANGLVVVPMSLWSEYIDFTWRTFWQDAKHPDPSGKWSRKSTPEERAEAERKIALAKKQIDELADKTKRAYEPKLQEMQDRFAFDAAAAKLRGDRKMRDFEWKMLQVWQAKSEDDVVAKMGRPHFTNTGNLHLLTYSHEFDNRVTVGSSTGEVWEEGLYTNCDVEFVTMADSQGTYRVADILLSVDSSNIMATNSRDACGPLLNTPGR